MTYHPIDKPTEPGWYWCRDSDGWMRCVNAYLYDDVLKVEMRRPEQFHGYTWYGPAIEPPATDGPTQGTVR